MGAALAVETLKLRKATAARVAAVAVVVVAPAMSAGFLAAARSDIDGPLAAKIAPMLQGTGWTGLMGFVGQILSIGMLLAVGVVVSWSFGREFTDGTFGSLFALPTPRRDVATAKIVVLVHWGLDVAVAAVALTLVLGMATGLGLPDAAAWSGAGKALVIAVLSVLLAIPLAWFASVFRGYLPGIAALIGTIMVTQVVTIAGVGAWFPYAAPGMWSGMGGLELAETVTPVQLLLAVPVAVVGAAATVWWWDRAEVV